MKDSAKRKQIVGYVKTIRVLLCLVLVLTIICGILIGQVVRLNNLVGQGGNNISTPNNSNSNTPNTSNTSMVSSAISAKDKALMALADELDDWNMALVNRKNPLPDGYTVDTSLIAASYARDVGMSFDSRAVTALNNLCAAAEKDGITLLVISSFRTHARQTTLYNNQVAKQKAKHPELSEAEVKELASTISAYPGTSEHELGLAVDFNSVEETFEHTRQFAWLQSHAAEFGFVMRYPKSKEDITGVIYEPWHYRYVGKNHADKMNELSYCLEEYTEYLKNYK